MKHDTMQYRRWSRRKRQHAEPPKAEDGPDLCFVCLTELVDGECPKCREAA